MNTLKIEFEGCDGSGKTTALKYFVEQAKLKGLSVVETREVGNPNIPACVELRKFVLDPSNNLSGMTMEFIFSAMRIENDRWYKQLVASESAPNLVVSDRGWFSHLSYTDHNESVEFTQMLYLDFLANITLLPDAVIYFNVDTETALKRRIKRGEGMADAIEIKGVGYQELVRDSFQKYLKKTSVQVFEINANDTIEGVQFQICRIIDDLINYKNSTREYCGAI